MAPSPVVRAAREADLPELTALYNHYIVNTAVTFDLEPFSVEGRRAWFSHYGPSGAHRLLVATEGDALLGYVTSSPFRPKAAYGTTVETSVYYRPDAQRRGLGTLLYGSLFEQLAGLGLHRAVAGATLPNAASVRLHARQGFSEVGVFSEVGFKFGKYWDVVWMQRALGGTSAPARLTGAALT